MSKNKQQLLKELELLEKEEQNKSIIETMDRMRKDVGIGYASHNLNLYFNNKRKSYDFNMFYIKDVGFNYLSEPAYIIDEVRIYKREGEAFWIDYSENQHRNDIPTYLCSKIKITLNEMELFINKLIPSIEVKLDELRHDYKQGLMISQGDHGIERSRKEQLEKVGFKFINISDLQSDALELLNWENHPFLYNEYLLLSEESIAIIINQIEDLKKSALDWGGKTYERDIPRAEKLSKLVLKLKDKLKSHDRNYDFCKPNGASINRYG